MEVSQRLLGVEAAYSIVIFFSIVIFNIKFTLGVGDLL